MTKTNFVKEKIPTNIHSEMIARNSIINLVSLGIPIVIGLVTIPITLKLLGLDRFAVLSLAWVIVGYFSFFDLGVGRSITKFVSESIGQRQYDRISGYFWTAVFSQIAMGLAGSLAISLATPFLVNKVLNVPTDFRPEMMTTLYILAVSMPVMFVSSSFRGMLESAQRFDLVNVVRVPSSVLNFVIPVVGAWIGMKLPGIMVMIVLSRMVAAAIWFMMDLRLFPALKTRIRVRKELIRPLFVFGGWVTVSSIISPLLSAADRLMIGSLLTLKMVSYYSAPFEMTSRFGIIPGSLVITLFPAFSFLSSSEHREKALRLFFQSFKYLLVVTTVIVTFVLFLAKFIIILWLGKDFSEQSTTVLQILALGFLANSLAQIPFGFIQGHGRADITAKFHFIEAVAYIPLLWLLIKTWGIDGAALGWTIRVTLDLALLLWASLTLSRRLYVSLPSQGLFRSASLAAIFIVLAIILMKNWLGAVFFLVALILFLLGQWFLAFKKEERTWFKRRLRILLRLENPSG